MSSAKDVLVEAMVWLRKVRNGSATIDEAIADIDARYAVCCMTSAEIPNPPAGGDDPYDKEFGLYETIIENMHEAGRKARSSGVGGQTVDAVFRSTRAREIAMYDAILETIKNWPPP